MDEQKTEIEVRCPSCQYTTHVSVHFSNPGREISPKVMIRVPCTQCGTMITWHAKTPDGPVNETDNTVPEAVEGQDPS
jgi:endogenous inhibitor of DNA gyrase (YacG/DUF329 family)